MITLDKKYKFSYVAELPSTIQQAIKKAITEALTADNSCTNKNLENGLNGKVYDLEDTITIKYI